MNIEEKRMVVEPIEVLEDISLDEKNPERCTRIGADLEERIKKDLVCFLRKSIDVFAWSHEDIPGIDLSVITHHLNVYPSSKPIRQKKRVFAPERDNAIKEEVQKLTVAKFIREVYYPDWLANIVMVKKAACPKDSYSLPRIDQLVDSIAGHKLLSFMDAFFGYNQIRMDNTYQEKTSFITSQGLFCYKVMPFGLKNAGATYRRLVNHMFHSQIGWNVEVYVDDMLVKSQDKGKYLDDLQETFDTLRYQPRHAIKAQTLADFIAEFTPSYEDLSEVENRKKWIVHMDGSSTQFAGRIGVVLLSPKGDKLKHKVRLQYQTTNNEVEYEALLKGLELAKSVEAKMILVLGDSYLVIGQVNGTCEAKEERMKKYLNKVVRLVKKFKEANFIQIPRKENMEADTLVKEALASEGLDEFDEIQYLPSIDFPELYQIEGEENWITLIISYLKDGKLLEGKDETRKLRVRSARYVLMNEVLYKRGFSQPYLRCLVPDEANYVSREVHEGACGNHSGARSLVHKVICVGYYWPNMQADAKAYVKVCD
ncbi:uncharacterized protein LOC115966689 [Quercus lobata]|uniref:uncharacterized protein LOC115966689 n=1 Tax=Quercus lobata TaxID=97700 RepID=UPI001246CCC3|nr:uncharacterized protein LOC115966689 [Quercus lobata]